MQRVAEQHQRGRQPRAQRRQRVELHQVVVADRRDHPHRQVGGRRELRDRRREPLALLGARAQREQLLELVDHHHDRAAGGGLGDPRRGLGRRARQQRPQVIAGDAGRFQPERQRSQRCRARPQRDRAPARRQAGQHPGVDERALAGARWPDHHMQGPGPQPFQERGDLGLAADEPPRIPRRVRCQPEVRCGLVVTGHGSFAGLSTGQRRAAHPRCNPLRAECDRELQLRPPALLGALGQRPLEEPIERRRQPVADRRHRGIAVQLGVLRNVRRMERPPPGDRLVGDHPERVQVGRRPDVRGVDPLLGRHVRRRSDRRVGVGQAPQVAAAGARRGGGLRDRLHRTRHAIRAGGQRGGLRGTRVEHRGDRAPRSAIEQLGDAEIQQLRRQPSPALDHHHVRRLEVAVHDPALVRRVHDLRELLEERHEPLERHRPVLVQPAVQPHPLHHLHRDPEQPVLALDPERVDVRRPRVVELRRQLRLAQEPLQHHAVVTQPRVQHLDHGLAPQQRLLAAVHRSVSALADPRAQHELAELAAGEILDPWHPRLHYHRRSPEERERVSGHSACAWASGRTAWPSRRTSGPASRADRRRGSGCRPPPRSPGGSA